MYLITTLRVVTKAGTALDCGSLLPLCGGRSLLRVGRSERRGLAPRRTQQAAPHRKAAAGCRSPKRFAPDAPVQPSSGT